MNGPDDRAQSAGGTEAIVVVPARDEASRITACLEALGAQTVGRAAFTVVLVLDACCDDTGERARRAADRCGLALTIVSGPGRGTGPALRAGFELAGERLLAAGRPHGLIVSTDADSRPEPTWLERQLSHRDRGVEAIAGRIELDPDEARALPVAARRARERDAAERLRELRRIDPDAAHHHFAGASLGMTAEHYRRVGGLEPRAALEDDGFAARLARAGVPVLRASDVVVVTSARVDGRATRGLSVDLAVARWMASRRFDAARYPVSVLAAGAREDTVTVIVPVKECADTLQGVLEISVGPARRAGLVDELLVVDAGSDDGSAQVARRCGARVVQQDEIRAELGPALGKGDAMWRGLQACDGDIVCFLDGDTRDPDPAHLLGLLGPLLADPRLELVKGSFERPLETGTELAHEGGRVTELMARPLINLHEPLLAGFSQPLAGEFAARRALLEAIPFPVGYGIEIAVLVDALRSCGLDALAECRLGTRRNRHQPLRALGEMAYAVLAAVVERLPADDPAAGIPPTGRYLKPWADGARAAVPILERPPIRDRV